MRRPLRPVAASLGLVVTALLTLGVGAAEASTPSGGPAPSPMASAGQGLTDVSGVSPNIGGPGGETPAKVINKTTYTHWIDKANLLTSCYAQTDGQLCAITKSYSVAVTAGTAYGVSTGQVKADLSMSTATTTTVSASCSQANMKRGQTFSAWPYGDRYTYQLQQAQPTGTKTSGQLTAFDPKGISCALS